MVTMVNKTNVLAVAGVLVAAAFVQWFARWQRLRRLSKANNCQELPTERPWDLLGVFKLWQTIYHINGRTSLENSNNLFNKLGDTYQVHVAGERVVWTCDPLNIRQILVNNFTDYNNSDLRLPLFEPITAHGIFAVDGDAWKAARRVYRDVFSRTREIVNLDMQEKHFQNLKRHLQEADGPINIFQLFFDLFVDVTTDFVLGHPVGKLSPNPDPAKLKFMVDLVYVKKRIARDGFLGPLAMFVERKKFITACKDVHEYINPIIQKALDDKNKRKQTGTSLDPNEPRSVLTRLAEYTDELEDLRDGTITLLIAGIDSVTSMLSSTFFLLSRHPEVFDKLRDHIIGIAGHDGTDYDQIRSMSYMRYVFNESMRIYTPVPFNARKASKDTVLPRGGGSDGMSPVVVGKGDRLVFSSWSTHRSMKAFGEDANEFIPERWESLSDELVGYIPFNLGPRACPGQHYAMAECSYMMVRILQNFSTLKSHDTKVWRENIGLNLSNVNGVWVELK